MELLKTVGGDELKSSPQKKPKHQLLFAFWAKDWSPAKSSRMTKNDIDKYFLISQVYEKKTIPSSKKTDYILLTIEENSTAIKSLEIGKIGGIIHLANNQIFNKKAPVE